MGTIRLLALWAAAASAAWRPPAPLSQIAIWPGAAPGAAPLISSETVSNDWIENVSTPTMTVFPAKGKNTGVAVIVFPGGGFMGLAIGLEGTEVCDWLTAKGVACVLSKYRVPGGEDHWDKKLGRQVEPRIPFAFQDAQRTISLVRARAAEWGIDPHKIGVMGFSAGGFLAAKTAAEFDHRSYEPVDDADQQSCRPDFSAPIYPGHLWKPRGRSHELRLNPKVRVTRRTPPTFLLQAEDDDVDNVNQVLTYYIALKDAGVPAELHIYAHGGHAFGLRRTKLPISEWPALVERWLKTIGMITE